MKRMFAGLMLVASVASVSFALNTPVITSAENCGAFTDVRWSSVGPVQYDVHRTTYPGGVDRAAWYSGGTRAIIGNPERVNASVVSVTTGSVSLAWNSGLTNGVTYYFRVQAVDGGTVSAFSNEVSVYVSNRSILGYRVYTNLGSYATVADLPLDMLNYTCIGLGEEQTYICRVSAVSSLEDTDGGYTASLSPANDISTTTAKDYVMSYELDSFVISVATTGIASVVVAGAGFPVIVTGKNSAGDVIPLDMDDSALIQSVLASNESLTGSDILRTTFPKMFNGTRMIYYFAYTKAETIKIKITYAGKTALSDAFTVMPGALATMDTETPPSMISGQMIDIVAFLRDLYGNHIKSIKIDFKVKKGKGKLDKDGDYADVTGKVKIKFFHDDVTPGINTITITALHLTQDVDVNVVVLVNGKNGGTIVASEDPNTQVIIPPGACSEDVQLSIKTGCELLDTIKVKVNNANDKESNNMCTDKVRGFECKKEDGSDYGNFLDLVTMEIPYKDDDNDDIVDGTCIKVDDIKICRLNEQTECWEAVKDGGCNEVDRVKKCVRAHVRHFSTYNIGIPSVVGLSEFHVYPNPVNFSKAIHNTLKFGYLPQNTKIEIYDITGRLVQSINSLDSNIAEWNGKNEAGESVSMGLYIYLLTDGNGNKKTGKIGVQK
jgi:hypothetical protein